MIAPLRARLATAVEDGRLTDEQSSRILDHVTARLDDVVRHGFRHEFHPLHAGRH